MTLWEGINVAGEFAVATALAYLLVGAIFDWLDQFRG